MRRDSDLHLPGCPFRQQRGLTLIEVLVAFTVFVVVAAAAFIIFTKMRQTEKIGRQAVEQQQTLRIVFFDDFVPQLRKAGLNYNTTGNKTLPDEQIEGAWAGVVVFRADLDQADPVEAADPESVINGPWNAVSIGNDEIVAYFLAKPGGTGGSTVSVTADVHSGTTQTSPSGVTVAERDNAQEAVSIPNVALTQNDPPYTLYRLTLNNDATTWGSGNFRVLQPVADNIKSLTFTYRDSSGNVLTPPGGAEDATSVLNRKQIRTIGVEVVGLTEVPDPYYTDPDDSLTATQHYRKFTLAADVQPRNLGRHRVADIDLTPPSVPQNVSLCAGHCEGLIISWDPNPVAEGIAEYRIKYGTDPANLTQFRETALPWIFLPSLTDGATYYVSVAARDPSGNQSPYSTALSEQCRDTTAPTLTTPVAVDGTGVDVTGGGQPAEEGRIVLTWGAVTQHPEVMSCDPHDPVIRDLAGYRVHREASASYTPVTGNMKADESEVVIPTFEDGGVVNCRSYFYQVAAVDGCGHVSTYLPTPVAGMASTEVAPAAPTDVAAVYTGPGMVRVTWNAVNRDTGDNPVHIDTYQIWRQTISLESSEHGGPDFAQASLVGTVLDAGEGTLQWDDTGAPVHNPGHAVFYWVVAADDCVNQSEPGGPARALCSFLGTVSIVPGDGTTIPTGTISVTVSAEGDTFVGSMLSIRNEAGAEVFRDDAPGPGPWSYTWVETAPGTYTATAMVRTHGGCGGFVRAAWRLLQIVDCGAVSVDGVTLSNNGKQLIFNFNNNSTSEIELQAMDIGWTNPTPAVKLAEVNVGPNSPVIYQPAVNPTVFLYVDPVVNVSGGGYIQIIYDYAKDITGQTITNRFDFETVGATGTLRQCSITFVAQDQ